MMQSPIPEDEVKKQAAYQAVDKHIKSGMVVGIGSGTTIGAFIVSIELFSSDTPLFIGLCFVFRISFCRGTFG
jgi:ribose 5-phosphate isomerase